MKNALVIGSQGTIGSAIVEQLRDRYRVFEVNRANQIVVTDALESTVDDQIYVVGDCCGFQQPDGSWVPPRAQSAHQMASTAAANIVARFHDKAPKHYVYRDYGSLVHLSKYSTVGSLMGALVNSSMFIEGRLAAARGLSDTYP